MTSSRRRNSLPQPLPPPLAELISERFKTLADPTRLRLLDLLRAQPMTIGQIASELHTTQQNVSKHIKLLADAGIVGRTKNGTAVVCSIADPAVFALCETVCDAIRRSSAEVEALFAPTGTDA